MSRLLVAASLLALLSAPVMAADGINSSNGTDLPMGAGSQTFVTLGAGQGTMFGAPNNGYVLFGPNKNSPNAWINTTTGDSSFSGNLTLGGNIVGDFVVGGSRVNQRANNAEWSSVLEFGAPSGNNSDRIYFQRANWRNNASELVLYLGDDANNEFSSDVGDAFSIIASDYQGGGQYYTRYRFASNGKAYFDTSLQIKSQVADEETIAIANTMKSCAVGEVVVKTGGPPNTYACVNKKGIAGANEGNGPYFKCSKLSEVKGWVVYYPYFSYDQTKAQDACHAYGYWFQVAYDSINIPQMQQLKNDYGNARNYVWYTGWPYKVERYVRDSYSPYGQQTQVRECYFDKNALVANGYLTEYVDPDFYGNDALRNKSGTNLNCVDMKNGLWGPGAYIVGNLIDLHSGVDGDCGAGCAGGDSGNSGGADGPGGAGGPGD